MLSSSMGEPLIERGKFTMQTFYPLKIDDAKVFHKLTPSFEKFELNFKASCHHREIKCEKCKFPSRFIACFRGKNQTQNIRHHSTGRQYGHTYCTSGVLYRILYRTLYRAHKSCHENYGI